MDIKEESSFLDFCSQNEREFFIKDPVKVETETVTSSSGIKTELEEDSICTQNKEHHVLRFNETIRESEIETKIDIKEEDWWLEREDSYINDDIKNETHQDFYSTKLPSLCKEKFCSYTSDLFSVEDSGTGISCNMKQNRPKCGSERKCQRQETVVIDTVKATVSSETSSDGKIFSMASSSKQSKLLHQSNTNNEHINQENCRLIFSHKYRNSYKCNIRSKCLNQFSAVKTHKVIDDAKRIHKCNICYKAFTQLSNLKRHKQIHEGIKPHRCNICNKAFSDSSGVKKHKLIHEGLKPHKCNICNKAFTQSSSLAIHKLIHEGIKPHKCKSCNKAFSQSSSLKKHKLIHEGIKPHKCDICNKAFTQLSDLKTHKFIHEGIKSHKCNVCNKAFTRLSGLKRHKLIHKDTSMFVSR